MATTPNIFINPDFNKSSKDFTHIFNETILSEAVQGYIEAIEERIKDEKDVTIGQAILEEFAAKEDMFRIGNLQSLNLYNIFGLEKGDTLSKNSALRETLIEAFTADPEKDRDVDFEKMTVETAEKELRERGMYYPLISSTLRALILVRDGVGPTTTADGVSAIIKDAVKEVGKDERNINNYMKDMRDLYVSRNNEGMDKADFKKSPLIKQRIIQSLPVIDFSNKDLDVNASDMMFRVYHIAQSFLEQRTGALSVAKRDAMQLTMSTIFHLHSRSDVKMGKDELDGLIKSTQGVQSLFDNRDVQNMSEFISGALNQYKNKPFDSEVEQYFAEKLDDLVKKEKSKTESTEKVPPKESKKSAPKLKSNIFGFKKTNQAKLAAEKKKNAEKTADSKKSTTTKEMEKVEHKNAVNLGEKNNKKPNKTMPDSHNNTMQQSAENGTKKEGVDVGQQTKSSNKKKREFGDFVDKLLNIFNKKNLSKDDSSKIRKREGKSGTFYYSESIDLHYPDKINKISLSGKIEGLYSKPVETGKLVKEEILLPSGKAKKEVMKYKSNLGADGEKNTGSFQRKGAVRLKGKVGYLDSKKHADFKSLAKNKGKSEREI